eukprot:scaffold3273_cov148-Cylindrotheca_fusiformis.AAC.6
MKFVISPFAILAMAETTFGQDCSICPNGITFPEQVVSGQTCEAVQTTCVWFNSWRLKLFPSHFPHIVFVDLSFQNSDVAYCYGLKAGFAEECCPEQKEILFKDNACRWCPNGIDSSDTPVTSPVDPTETITCFEVYLV